MPAPLFSRRKAIADQCEQWCKDNNIPACPLNIISGALTLGLLSEPDKVVSVQADGVTVVEVKLVGCAACDRGDFQLGHADDCPTRQKIPGLPAGLC
jgi:hypothetical protein